MTDQNIAVAQLKQLRVKLEAAVASRASLEEDFKAQSSLLIDFIDRLSKVCKGTDLELDNRLAKLRALFKKSVVYSDIEAEVTIISELLKKHATKNENYIRELHSQFHSACKNLQKAQGLPNQLRRDLRDLIDQNTDSKEALIQYVPELNSLLTMYQNALAHKSNEIPAGGLLAATKQDTSSFTQSSASNVINGEVINEIKRIITNLSLSEDNNKQLVQISNKLNENDSSEVLISHIVTIFNIISNEMDQQRDVAESFLTTLSNALIIVQQAVKNSLVSFKTNDEKRNKLNKRLSKQINEMTVVVDKAMSLAKLKSDVNERLTEIAQTMATKNALESSQNAELAQQLSAMKKQVDVLEAQSKSFEKRLQEQKLKSLQDALTKLNNRAAFDEYFAQMMVKFHQKPFNLSIAIFDLDNFKRINDTYGHTAGDKTLQVIANTLKKNLDNSAYVARYGGEEFVAIFNGLDEQQLLDELDKVRKCIVQLPFTFKNNKVNLSTSIGATHIQASDNIHVAFERADTSLYKAKEQGKNRVIYS